MTELVRLVGHAQVPVEEFRTKCGPLLEQYGQETMQAAATELLEVERGSDGDLVRLSDEARRLAAALIGRPPEPASDERLQEDKENLRNC